MVSDVNYPPFGSSTWPWAAAIKGEEKEARAFYAAWTNFATAKEFSWEEQWNTTEAPDRRVRRYAHPIYEQLTSHES